MYFRIFLFCLSFLFFASNLLDAHVYLRVRDPRGWHSMQGTIEEAVVTVRPQGVYTEIGLYLTFSARGWYYSPEDTLEVELFFDLPENSIVHDSWLWIEDEIIRGIILDKWTAASIYEDIVRRRRDPSILYKQYDNQYELRIFPMVASESRKVKISYLVPSEWGIDEVLTSLPTHILQASRYEVAQFHILTWPDQIWQDPKILEFPDIVFQSFSDTTFGEYRRADIPSESLDGNMNLAFDSPLENGIYVNNYQNEDEGIYQLVFLPSKALDLSTSSKLAVLIDHDTGNSTTTSADILNGIKNLLHTGFSQKDSFNLILSNLPITRASESWLAADSVTIEQTFNNLDDDPVSGYSNLPTLLANGIEFITNNGNNASIVLVSSSDQLGDYEVANQLIDDIMALMDHQIPIHVADYQDRDFEYYYIGNRSYYGNEYFYTNISRMTGANYFTIWSVESLTELLSTAFHSVLGFLSSFDLHTGLEGGYCYGRYTLNSDKHSVYLNRPLIQVGKYQGSLPFIIEASGMFESEIFSQQFVVQEENIQEADSLSEEAWTGNYIQYLESKTQTNDIINEIIYHSLNERVLSVYTAFLCLEPSRGGEVCYDCIDESEIIGDIDEETNTTANDSLFRAYPNPFNSQVKIEISLPQLRNSKDVRFRIYNLLGQVVRSFNDIGETGENRYQFIWDGKNDAGAAVSSGTYFFVVQANGKRNSLKLVYMK